jgi:hypothetical protein
MLLVRSHNELAGRPKLARQERRCRPPGGRCHGFASGRVRPVVGRRQTLSGAPDLSDGHRQSTRWREPARRRSRGGPQQRAGRRTSEVWSGQMARPSAAPLSPADTPQALASAPRSWPAAHAQAAGPTDWRGPRPTMRSSRQSCLRWSWCELSRNATHRTRRRPTRSGGVRLRRQHARIGISRPPEPTAVCVALSRPRQEPDRARRRLAQTARARRVSASTAPAEPPTLARRVARAAANHSQPRRRRSRSWPSGTVYKRFSRIAAAAASR